MPLDPLPDTGHVAADCFEAIEAAISGVPMVSAVYDFMASQGPPSPPRDKVIVELAFGDGGDNNIFLRRSPEPKDFVLNRPMIIGARITAAIPRDMSAKDFMRNVIAPIEVAVANSAALRLLANEWFVNGIEWQPAQDSDVTTLSAIVPWLITFQTEAGAPGKAL